jgi:hypothetical protein
MAAAAAVAEAAAAAAVAEAAAAAAVAEAAAAAAVAEAVAVIEKVSPFSITAAADAVAEAAAATVLGVAPAAAPAGAAPAAPAAGAAAPAPRAIRMTIDGVRLINVLILLKALFLTHLENLTRAEKDDRRLNDFWVKVSSHRWPLSLPPSGARRCARMIPPSPAHQVAGVFNGDDPALLSFVSAHDSSVDWYQMGLSFGKSGYVMTADKAKAMFNDLRRDHMKHQGDFRQSGGGDGSMLGDPPTSTTVHSSTFKDFCTGKPTDLYFYEALLKYDLLASAATDLPAGPSSSSTEPGDITIHVDFSARVDSPATVSAKKRALRASERKDNVLTKSAKLDFSSKARAAVEMQQAKVDSLEEGVVKDKAEAILAKLERVAERALDEVLEDSDAETSDSDLGLA